MCKCDRVSIASIFRTTGIQNLFKQQLRLASIPPTLLLVGSSLHALWLHGCHLWVGIHFGSHHYCTTAGRFKRQLSTSLHLIDRCGWVVFQSQLWPAPWAKMARNWPGSTHHHPKLRLLYVLRLLWQPLKQQLRLASIPPTLLLVGSSLHALWLHGCHLWVGIHFGSHHYCTTAGRFKRPLSTSLTSSRFASASRHFEHHHRLRALIGCSTPSVA